MKLYNFVFLIIFIFAYDAYAMKQNDKLAIIPLPLPDIHKKYSDEWIALLSNWAQYYYRAKALYENAHAYQKKEQAEGKNGKSSDSGLLIMQMWLQWCESTLRETIGDPNALIGSLLKKRFLDVVRRLNQFCLCKLLVLFNADPGLKNECEYYPIISNAKKLKWAKLFASSKHFKPDIVDDCNRNLVMNATHYDCNKEVLKFYLDKNIDVHYTNNEGNVLHLQIQQDIKDIALGRLKDYGITSQVQKAELLIKYHVNMNHLKNGFTPLDVVMYAPEHHPIVKPYCNKMELLLRKHGAKKAEELKAEKQ